MSDTTTTTAAPSRHPRFVAVVRAMPATLSLAAVLILVGLLSQGLWRPVQDQGWFEAVAYGLPAFEQGRWWTPLTGTFFVARPLVFVVTLLSLVGMGYLEWKRGSRVTLLYFGFGQLFAIFATAAFAMLAGGLAWPWAQSLAQSLDVGPSGGTMACIAAAAGLMAAPWRQRAWAAVFIYAAVSLLFLGTIADVEHAFAILLVLMVDRSFRIQRTTVDEQRLLTVALLIALGAIQIVTLVAPTNGPFGHTEPLDNAWYLIALDAVVILLLASGLRNGRRWAWLLMTIWATFSVVSGTVGIVLIRSFLEEAEHYVGDLDVEIATTVLWFFLLLYLIVTRRAFRVRRRRRLESAEAAAGAPGRHRAPDVDEVKEVVRAHGGGTLSWMATWEGMDYLRTSTGIVPFQQHLGVAIVLADPLGPAEGVATSTREFIDAAEQQGLVPCFFSAGAATRAAMPEDWRDLIIADDTIVDLEGLAFTGKAWSHVRQALNRGDRDGMTFRLTTLGEVTWGVRQQLRAISEAWVGEKDLPEMRFTLGTLQEAEDPEVRLALAIAPDGDVDGFLSWLPVFGPGGEHHGWTLDLMRRRDGGFGPVMEYLIGSSARAFAEEGAAIVSLSGAPLAHEPSEDDGVIAQLLGTLSSSLEPVYGFKSLHRFKSKFNPRYEPISLLYRDEGDLTKIAAALTRAFLPDATLRQFAAAGVDLLRRDG